MKTLEVEVKDGVQLITLDHKGNSFTPALLSELHHALELSTFDESIHAVVITGRKLFSAGGDIFGMKGAIEAGNPAELVHEIISHAAKVISTILSHPLPVVAAINRAAAGAGLSLAMACDHVVVADNAKLVMAFGSLALIPDSGASYLFPLKFGRSMTLMYSSTGQAIDLELAMHRGSIDELCPPEKLLDVAIKWANKYREADRLAVTRTKQLINSKIIEEISIQYKMEEEFMVEMAKRDAFAQRVNQMVEKFTK